MSRAKDDMINLKSETCRVNTRLLFLPLLYIRTCKLIYPSFINAIKYNVDYGVLIVKAILT